MAELFYCILFIFICILIFVIISFAKEFTGIFLTIITITLSIIITRIVLKKRKENKIKYLYTLIENEKTSLYGKIDKNKKLCAIHTMKEIFDNVIKFKGSENVKYKINKIHQELLFEIIKDCQITEDEKEILREYEKTFLLDDNSIKVNRREAYLTVYQHCIKDRILTKNEESILHNIFLKLEISPNEITSEQNFLRDLSLSRELNGKELKPLQVPIKLSNDEQCFFVTNEASIYKARQKNYDFLPAEQSELSGKLYITNKRIIISYSGNIEFERRLSTIDVLSNWDDYFIQISFKGKDKPLFLMCSKPYLTRIIISNYLDKVRC